ncbi:MAG: hypothetical protein ACP5HX_11055, partial [Thermoproteota archaeon]
VVLSVFVCDKVFGVLREFTHELCNKSVNRQTILKTTVSTLYMIMYTTFKLLEKFSLEYLIKIK